MPATEAVLAAVEALRASTGVDFKASDTPVTGTNVYVVYAPDHDLPDRYTESKATLGFRVPGNIGDAPPEDSFFLAPATLKLREADPVRRSVDLNRAGIANGHVAGALPDNPQCLVFSWHLWDRVPWDRRKHTLQDHYTHCLRRLELPEHD